MKKTLFIAFIAVGIAASMVAAQGGNDAAQQRGSITQEGGVGFINPGSPTVSDADSTKQPIPRLPDGKVDLTGPWVGGGSNADIEAEGGLKPGELPLLPWARELRGNRKEEQEPYTVCLPMGVPRVNPYPWKLDRKSTRLNSSHRT